MLSRLGWLLPVSMAAAVYCVILPNYFFSDDFLHFWHLTNHGLARFVLRMHGGHLCTLRNLLMAGLHALFGMHALAYFALALALHMVNVFLLYDVARLLTGSRGAAAVAAAVWGINPTLAGSLEWMSVHGHVLAAVFILLVLRGLTRARAGAPIGRGTPWLWAAAMVCAALSFGVGIGAALAMPAIAYLLLPAGPDARRAIGILVLGAMATVAIYFGQYRLYVALYGERVGTMSLELAFANVRAQIGFLLGLIGYAVVSTILGMLIRPLHYPGVVGAIALCGAALAAGAVLGRAPARTARPLLACALLAAAVYALIAAGRGALVDGYNFGAMVRTARYHYVGPLAAALAIAVVLAELATLLPRSVALRRAALGTWAAAVLALALRIGAPVKHYEDARRETEDTLAAIAAIAAATPRGMDVYIVNQPFRPMMMLASNLVAFPGWAGVFAVFHADDTLNGRRIRFVIDDPDVLAAARHGRRAEALLTGSPGQPTDGPASGG